MEEISLIYNTSPSFYGGLNYIEPLVRYHLDPSHENEKVLYHSYMGSLRNYWIKAKRVLTNPTPQEVSIALERRKELYKELSSPLRYGSRFYDVDVSPEYFTISDDEYLLRLKERSVDLHRIFKKYLRLVKQKFDKITILKAFYFLSLILCLDPILMLSDDEGLMEISDSLLFGKEEGKRETEEALERLYISDLSSVYPLSNDIGVFSIGGYLFAYGNGVDLFGIPSGIATFDLTTDCSTEFFIHEMDHFYRMKKIKTFYGSTYSREDAERVVKQEQIRILELEDYSMTDKEVLLLGLWYILHEISILLSGEGSFEDLFGVDNFDFLEEALSTKIYDDFATPSYQTSIQEFLEEIEEEYPEVYQKFMSQKPVNDIPVEESMAIYIFVYAYNYYS